MESASDSFARGDQPVSLVGPLMPPGIAPALIDVLDRIKRVYASNVEAYQDEVLDEIELIFQEHQHEVLGVFTTLNLVGTDPAVTEPFRQARQRAKRRIAALQAPTVQPLTTKGAKSARLATGLPVAIFSEEALQNDLSSLLPCEAYAFGWASAPGGGLGIRLLWHSPLFGLRVSALLRTGPEDELRRFARQVVARHKRERWVLESEIRSPK